MKLDPQFRDQSAACQPLEDIEDRHVARLGQKTGTNKVA